MPGSSTTPGRSDLAMVRPKRVAFRARNSVGTRGLAFAAQWLAYALPYRRFVGVLTDANARLGADVDRSGRTEARTGLRMMPTSPRSPLSFRTAGFPRYGWKAGLFRRGLPNTSANLSLLPACAGRCLVCVHPSCASSPQQWHRSESGLWARLRTAIRWSLHHPRGPRSGPGCSVPVRHHLIGPIRPTRGHIAISPHGGLYAMPSLCGSAGATRERFRAFAAHSLLACRPLRPRGVRSSTVPEQRCRHGLRRE